MIDYKIPSGRVSIEQVMAWGPCYSRSRIDSMSGGKDHLTLLEVLDLDIPAKDRVWAALHEEFLTLGQMRLFACSAAETVLGVWYKSWPDAAGDAAWGAAMDAAMDAAWAAQVEILKRVAKLRSPLTAKALAAEIGVTERRIQQIGRDIPHLSRGHRGRFEWPDLPETRKAARGLLGRS